MSIQQEDQAKFQSIKILIDIPVFQKTSLTLPFEFYPLIDCPVREPSFLVQLPYQIKFANTWKQPYSKEYQQL